MRNEHWERHFGRRFFQTVDCLKESLRSYFNCFTGGESGNNDGGESNYNDGGESGYNDGGTLYRGHHKQLPIHIYVVIHKPDKRFILTITV